MRRKKRVRETFEATVGERLHRPYFDFMHPPKRKDWKYGDKVHVTVERIERRKA